MPKFGGIAPEITARIPYVPIQPWDWFEENGVEDKMGGPPPAMGEGPKLTPTLRVKNGKAAVEGGCLYGGKVSDDKAEDLRIVTYDGAVGGVYAEGAGTDYTVEGAVISLSGAGMGLGGETAGAGVGDHAKLTLRDVFIDADGLSRTATSAGGGSVLRVYDSVISSHGAPYGADAPDGGAKMHPPAPLEIDGNNRTHCTVENSYSYFYDTLVTCDGWAALSTDASNGFVYLEANDCKVVTTKSGYGAYADWGCHDVFNGCRFDVACMAAIAAGESSVVFRDCALKCGTYLALIHCVMGRHTEVAELTLDGVAAETGKEAILIHGHNAVVTMTDCEIHSANGVLVHVTKNADPNAARVNGRPTPGIEIRIADMNAEGDILMEDPERPMRVYLSSAVLTGAVRGGATLLLDLGSKWFATGDSDVVLGQDVNLEQLDAPKGVTITAKAADGQGEYALASGGKLIVKE